MHEGLYRINCPSWIQSNKNYYYDFLNCHIVESNKILKESSNKYSLELEEDVSHCEVYFQLTNGCNYGCIGCSTASNKISPDNAVYLTNQRLASYLKDIFASAKKNNFTSLKIKWAGGEPLLDKAFDLLKYGQKAIIHLKKMYPEIKLEQVVITNGVYLSKAKRNFIKLHDLRISLSIWGIQKVHDLLRRPKNNKESFTKVISNLKACLKENINVNINHVITPYNVKSLGIFLESFWDANSEHYHFKDLYLQSAPKIYFSIHRPGSNLSYDAHLNYYRCMVPHLKSAFELLANAIKKGVYIQSFINFDYLNFGRVSTKVCSSKLSYVAIGPNGIKSCHEELYQENESAEITDIFWDMGLKNFKQRSTHTLSEDSHLILHGGSGCPRQRFAFGGKSAIIELYKNIIDDLLGLEILRLKVLKYAHVPKAKKFN